MYRLVYEIAIRDRTLLLLDLDFDTDDIILLHSLFINHLLSLRNVLVESARISRNGAQPLDQLKASLFDALVFPGGFGAAKNL